MTPINYLQPCPNMNCTNSVSVGRGSVQYEHYLFVSKDCGMETKVENTNIGLYNM